MSDMLRRLDVNSIKFRLIVCFALFGIVPAVLVFAVYEWFKADIEHAYRQPIADTATAMGDVIDRNLFERYGDVQAFGVNAAATAAENWRNPAPGNPLIAAMNAYMTNYGIYRLMVLVDAQGGVLAVNSVDPTGKAIDTSTVYAMNFAKASWFTRAIAGDFLNGKNGLTGTVVEQPAKNPVVASIYADDGFTITFAAPVKNAAGEVVGVWVNFADFGLVEEIAATFHKALAARGLDTAEITVLDAKGTILVDYDPAVNGATYARNPEIVGRINLAEQGLTPAIAAVEGKSGVMLAAHARKGIEQTAGYAHTSGAYTYPGLGWSVLVRVSDEDINTVANTVEFWMAIFLALAVVVIGVLAWTIARGISGPLTRMTGAMERLAAGDVSIEVPSLDRKDEIGNLAAALQIFKRNKVEADRLAAEQVKEQEAKARRQAEVEKLIAGFDRESTAALGSAASAATQLEATAKTLNATAEETSRRTTAVAAASEEAAANVQTIASAAEELTSSVGEISRQVADAAHIAAQAVEDAKKTDGTVQGLSDAAQKIGNVVSLINDIAGQTNLLALNATIEAARAGEAGKGFAVVASEVKNLATQTARATDEISTQIAAMQSVTGEAVAAIRNIAGTIARISEISNAIAAAVEEQGVAVKEIARNVDEAANGAKDVTRNIDGVSQAAAQTGQSSSDVFSATRLLAQSAGDLKTQIEGFLQKVKAA
jgi:methyl-accepting chemotaxis protein